jgi:hypothetical protein
LGSEENYFWKTAKERAVDLNLNEEDVIDMNVGAGNTAMEKKRAPFEPELG